MQTSNGIVSRLNAVQFFSFSFLSHPFYLLRERYKSNEILKFPISFDPTHSPKPFHYFQPLRFIWSPSECLDCFAGGHVSFLKQTAAIWSLTKTVKSSEWAQSIFTNILWMDLPSGAHWLTLVSTFRYSAIVCEAKKLHGPIVPIKRR